MKRFLMISAMTCLPALAQAQTQSDPDEGMSLMERGAQMFLDGMLREMSPALEDLTELGDRVGPALRSFAREMGPALANMLEQVEDWSVYEAPEILPNGDIIMRRKPETEPDLPEQTPNEEPPVIFLDESPQVDI